MEEALCAKLIKVIFLNPIVKMKKLSLRVSRAYKATALANNGTRIQTWACLTTNLNTILNCPNYRVCVCVCVCVREHACVCICVCVCMHTHLVAHSCLTLGNPMDCSPPGSSVHVIFQARIPEWVAISSSRGSSWSTEWTHISCIFCIGRRILYQLCHLGSPLNYGNGL